MLDPRDALARVMASVVPAASERVPLVDALGRVASEPVRAPIAVPQHADSAMDGFAVRAAETGPGVTLALRPVIAAGDPASEPLAFGCAAPIMTGAPLPPGADAVVIQEDTDASGDRVALRVAVRPGENARPAGNDIQRGDVLVDAGDAMTPARLGLLASVGLVDVAVAVRPRIALLATGSELVPGGAPLGRGQVYSSNPVVLAGYAREAGGLPRDLGRAPDDLDRLVDTMEGGLDGELLVTSGGVSVGRFDLVKEAFARLGVRTDFWKIRMKPGKPLAFGQVERGGRVVTVFGLPGNPVSSAVTFLQFVRPWIRAHLGDPRPYLPIVDATCAEAIPESPGRAKLIRVRLEAGPDGWLCRSAGNQSSGALTSVARAHGLLHRGPDQGGPAAGERVRVQLLDPSFLCGAADALW